MGVGSELSPGLSLPLSDEHTGALRKQPAWDPSGGEANSGWKPGLLQASSPGLMRLLGAVAFVGLIDMADGPDYS